MAALWAAISVPGAFAQVGEFSVSGGVSRFGNTALGTLDQFDQSSIVGMKDGFRLALRFTLNTYRFFGHEFGYAYSRSGVTIPGSSNINVPIHQGFYDFLVYATPEGSAIRPFAAGGGQFSSFFPPGTSVYYGNQVTKFGFNYGGGVKLRVTPIIGLRADIRDYVSGKPFDFPNQSGALHQVEISAGVAFMF